jgi:hypothetical protein
MCTLPLDWPLSNLAVMVRIYKKGDHAYDGPIIMPRKYQDIHLDNGALQTVFDSNHMSISISVFLA